jgi:hypothetical protein
MPPVKRKMVKPPTVKAARPTGSKAIGMTAKPKKTAAPKATPAGKGALGKADTSFDGY